MVDKALEESSTSTKELFNDESQLAIQLSESWSKTDLLKEKQLNTDVQQSPKSNMVEKAPEDSSTSTTELFNDEPQLPIHLSESWSQRKLSVNGDVGVFNCRSKTDILKEKQLYPDIQQIPKSNMVDKALEEYSKTEVVESGMVETLTKAWEKETGPGFSDDGSQLLSMLRQEKEHEMQRQRAFDDGEYPKYNTHSWHGTTILCVHLFPNEILIAVDSQRTQSYIADNPNNKRIMERLASECDSKFIEILNGVYATLAGDGGRSLKMIGHVEIHLFEEYTRHGRGPSIDDIGIAATIYFRNNRRDPKNELAATVFFFTWIDHEHRYRVIAVGDDHLDGATEINDTIFGTGSGSVVALRKLSGLKAAKGTVSKQDVEDQLIRAVFTDPYSGGVLKVRSLRNGLPPEFVYIGSFVRELLNPAKSKYANMVFNGKTMFVILDKNHENILSPPDLVGYLNKFDADICRDSVHWLCIAGSFMIYIVKMKSSECCEKWIGFCSHITQPTDIKEPIWCDLKFENSDLMGCAYYITHATKEMLLLAQDNQQLLLDVLSSGPWRKVEN